MVVKEVTMPTKLADFAGIYQELGFSIFPLQARSKAPVIEWLEYQHRRASGAEIKAWFENGKERNVAIVCGKISGTDRTQFVALDFDKPENYETWRTIAETELGCELKDTVPIVLTSQGYHAWFYVRQSVESQRFNTVEIRSEGNYVVAPGSIHPTGKRYEFLNPAITKPLLLDSLGEVGIDTASRAERIENSPNWVTQALQGVDKGSRNVTAFRLAGHFKNSQPQDITESLLLEWNTKNRPPLPDKELLTAIESAYTLTAANSSNSKGEGRGIVSVCHAEPNSVTKRDKALQDSDKALQGDEEQRNLSLETKDWIVETGGRWFLRSDVDKELAIMNPKDKANRRAIIKRMKASGELEEHEGISGKYRYRDANCEAIPIGDTFVGKPLAFKWPFGIEDYADLYPGNLIVVAGSPNAGKTALLLNFVAMNKDRFPINYFSSEMGDAEFNLRLSLFDDIEDWSFKPFLRSSSFADVIRPDEVNLIDFLEITDEFYRVSGILAGITRKLKKGIAIVAIQKKRGASLGRGGEFSLEKARLYLSMDNGELRLEKVKNYHRPDLNPNGMSAKFKLVNGCDFKIGLPATTMRFPGYRSA